MGYYWLRKVPEMRDMGVEKPVRMLEAKAAQDKVGFGGRLSRPQSRH